MSSGQSFGARYISLLSAQERLELETSEQRRASFTDVDAALDGLVLAALHSQRVIELSGEDGRGAVQLRLAEGVERGSLDEHFAVARQQERGAWYVPSSGVLAVGVVHLAYWWQTSSRYVLTLVGAEHAIPNFESTDAVVIWAALEPLFEELALPLKLRAGRWAGQKTAEKQIPYWKQTIQPTYAALGLSDEAVLKFAPDTGWAELDAQSVIDRRDALLAPWERADIDAARRLRTHRIGQLVERYYSKAKDGRAARARVMNKKDYERTLTAYFGGDWLALLDYLGEEPHLSEEVTKALPRPRLMVTTSQQAATVAAAHGLPPEEVERMLAAYWHQSDGASPVEQRVEVLERLWGEVDAIHARQEPGMKPLYELMGETHGESRFSVALLADLRRLWGTKLAPRWPERLVTEPSCGWAAARALGPALDFWQYVALNAWGICEGGRAHSELADFEEHLRTRTELLAKTGYPPHPALFLELRAAESKLGPVQEMWEEVSSETHGPLTTTMRVGGDTRRDGFEILRDIITRYRRLWTEQHLSAYLQGRWRSDLQEAGEAYHRHAADKAKPPTVKQFSKMASTAASHWFGGDLTGVYGALGLKSPLPAPSYSRLLPADQRAFMRRLRHELEQVPAQPASGGDQNQQEQLKQWLSRLIRQSLVWIELAEALGQQPELKQYGTHEFGFASALFSEDMDAAWQMYCQAIQRALAEGEDGPSTESAPERQRQNFGVQAPAAASPSVGVPPEATTSLTPTEASGAAEAVVASPIADGGRERSRPRGFLQRLLGR